MNNPLNIIRYIKSEPTTYLIQYSRGKVVRQGTQLSFFYFAPNSTLVSIPTASTDQPFMFAETTADFQEVTIQGRVIYRVVEPESLSGMMNFALDGTGKRYVSDDPEKLNDRILNQVRVAVRSEIQGMLLDQAITSGDNLIATVQDRLKASQALIALGVSILDMAILAIKPTPETARALEAEMREHLLQASDEAVFRRRNAAVEQERAIKENELQTDIAVAKKQQQVKEAEMEAKRAVAGKRREIEHEEMESQIVLEKSREALILLATDNARKEADARAYAIGVVMEEVNKVDPRVLEAVAATGMQSDQLIARAFQGLAERADKIGELNISPDLLRQIMSKEA